MNPEGEFSDTTSDNNIEEVIEHKKGLPIGAATVFIIAALCLVVVFWFIYNGWNSPEPTPEPAPVVETPVEQKEVKKEEDPTEVEGRDSEILGLRIDTRIGRLFVLPNTGQTLYLTAEECTGSCLEVWTPYEASSALEEGDILGTVERGDGTLQYTWNGKAFYTYNEDDDRSVLGDGYEGKWNVARP